ncbi:MAG: nucleoside triphosphate pyrophosphohydrolase family protein [Muribaculaceae bacterium]|nr:nucleoside triphosphate pyrophosphohydrolase family protein [Muribaculaceae bacterium]
MKHQEYEIVTICEAPGNRGMTLNEYQQRAMTTCMDSCQNESYMMLNLVGEVGELASKMAKAIRKGKAIVDNNRFITEHGTETMADNEIADMRKECGDIMWQIAGLCSVMGWPLENVCRENLAKLASRKNRGAIEGSGDNR